jgi:hypothetical protein
MLPEAHAYETSAMPSGTSALETWGIVRVARRVAMRSGRFLVY